MEPLTNKQAVYRCGSTSTTSFLQFGLAFLCQSHKQLDFLLMCQAVGGQIQTMSSFVDQFGVVVFLRLIFFIKI